MMGWLPNRITIESSKDVTLRQTEAKCKGVARVRGSDGYAETVASDTGQESSEQARSPTLDEGWKLVFAWIGTGTLLYVLMQVGLSMWAPLTKSNPQALWSQVSPMMYEISATAFFTAMVINLNSLLFEDSASKRQLAAFSCFVKAAACYCDLTIALGMTPILTNKYGNVFIPARYLQWAVTTPTLVLVVSRLSDMPAKQVALAIVCDFLMVFSGLLSCFMSGVWHAVNFAVSCALFVVVMYMMNRMIKSAIGATGEDLHSRKSLQGISVVSTVVWSIFPLSYCLDHYTTTPLKLLEITNIAANFIAKVVFSSSVMYSNFITITQRQAILNRRADNKARIQIIRDLQQAMLQKDEFLSMMSHELRTPLNGIIQLSDALGRGAGGTLSEKGMNFIRTISNSGSQLLSIINDILDAASLKNGTLTIKHQQVHLSEVVDHVMQILAPLAKKGVSMKKMVALDTPNITGDRDRISQILYNLAGNALKFTASGSINMLVAPFQEKPDKYVVIKVTDTGIGIPRDKLDTIWRAFQQVDMSTTRKYGGTGLGLSLTKQLVEAHHGTITVKSRVGKGTSFTIILPIEQPTIQRVPPSPHVPSEAEQQPQRAKSLTPLKQGSVDDILPLLNPEDDGGNDGRRFSIKSVINSVLDDSDLAQAKHTNRTTFDNVIPVSPLSVPQPPHSIHHLDADFLPDAGSNPSLDKQTATDQRTVAPAGTTKMCRQLSASLLSKTHTTKPQIQTLRHTLSSLSSGSSSPVRNMKGSSCAKGANKGVSRSSGHSCFQADSSLSAMMPSYSDIHGTVQVLSVDDEMVNQLAMEEILTSSGYLYEKAMDAQEALEFLETHETLPDLILLDCMMPGMSGIEFCNVIREVIPSTVLPIIMVSAKSGEDNIIKGLRSGSNDFIRKPYVREELLARIETQLRMKNDTHHLMDIFATGKASKQDTEVVKLLRNILPDKIIERLKMGQKFIADSHSNVCVLFSDVVGFTPMSQKLSTAEVFLMLSNMFASFDKLVDRYSVYKVETIGDAYMAVCGHDEDKNKAEIGSPAHRLMGMAHAMLKVVNNMSAPDGSPLRIRIGIHCGPAYAGVIGAKCPRYCFMGDTINTASRMESSSFPMCIQISAAMYQQLGQPADFIQLERQIKGKGTMTTYLSKQGNWQEAMEVYNAAQQNVDAASLLSSPSAEAQPAPCVNESSLQGALDQVQAELKAKEQHIQQLEQQLHSLQKALAAVKAQSAASVTQAYLDDGRSTSTGTSATSGYDVETVQSCKGNAVAVRLLQNAPACSLHAVLADIVQDTVTARLENSGFDLSVLLEMKHDELFDLGLAPMGTCFKVKASVMERCKQCVVFCQKLSALVHESSSVQDSSWQSETKSVASLTPKASRGLLQ